MRILLVNWARISDGAALGGGVNVYAQQLALELVARGHEVMWLNSGQRYVGWENGAGECRVRRFEDWRGVRTFEVFNSPVVSPGPCQAAEPLVEVSSPALEAEVARLCGVVEPQIVHFHNIEGFSAGCIAAVRQGAPKARVLFSLHNYHTVCPQVYLMYQGQRPCVDFRGGLACAECLERTSPEAERAKRSTQLTPPRPERVSLFGRAKPQELPWPGRAVEVFGDTVAQRASRGASAPERNGADRQPLSNDITPEDQSPRNEYGQRRAGMVAMLCACDRVVAVSSFVRRKFEALGVDPRKLVTLPIGSRMTEIAAGAAAAFDPPSSLESGRPVRAVFMGYNNYYKGLPMLLDSLALMKPAGLARLHLCVHAKGADEAAGRLEELRARLGGLTVRGSYNYDDVPALLAGKDVGLVPSVWWDNGPQTVMEFFACGLPVIGAELGGIPDLVRHGVNGLLFRGNDRDALARTLEAVAAEPGRLADLRRNVRPPPTMSEHAVKVEALYNECLE
jgi:Glycosyl transferases group 1/Glycosyl transferase 4-like domain